MRAAVAVLLVAVLLLPGAVADHAPVRHDVEVVVGEDTGVVEHLDGVDRLRLPVPSDAQVRTVLRDGRPAAWAREGDVVHASGPGNYSVTYRLPRGDVDLVRTLPFDVQNASVRVDVPDGWQATVDGLDRTGSDPVTAEGSRIAAGTPYGVRVVPPVTSPATPGLVPFLALLGIGLLAAGGVAVWRLKRPERVEMAFWDHYRELRHRLILTLVPLGVAFIAFFVFRLEPVALGGVELWVPVPSETGGMAGQAFAWFESALLPVHVELIVTNPVDAITAEITVALFLAILATSPIAAYHASRFLGPALYPRERDVVLRSVPLLTGLFALGCLFGLVVIVPFAFDFLYGYGQAIGAITYVTAPDFVSFTVLLVVAFGLSFELPVAMVALSAVGVTGEFWREHWRIAVFAIFLFGAVVTPDGSGVTMIVVALPLTALYVLGIWLVERRGPDQASKV